MLPVLPYPCIKVEEPEDGYIPQPEHEEGSNTSTNKRSASTDQKENASPKKRRTKTTDIALENPPTDEVTLRIYFVGSSWS